MYVHTCTHISICTRIRVRIHTTQYNTTQDNAAQYNTTWHNTLPIFDVTRARDPKQGRIGLNRAEAQLLPPILLTPTHPSCINPLPMLGPSLNMENQQNSKMGPSLNGNSTESKDGTSPKNADSERFRAEDFA